MSRNENYVGRMFAEAFARWVLRGPRALIHESQLLTWFDSTLTLTRFSPRGTFHSSAIYLHHHHTDEEHDVEAIIRHVHWDRAADRHRLKQGEIKEVSLVLEYGSLTREGFASLAQFVQQFEEDICDGGAVCDFIKANRFGTRTDVRQYKILTTDSFQIHQGWRSPYELSFDDKPEHGVLARAWKSLWSRIQQQRVPPHFGIVERYDDEPGGYIDIPSDDVAMGWKYL